MEVRITETTRSAGQWRKPSVAAKHYGVSLRTFRQWIKMHGLPYSKLPNGRILVCLDDVDQWLRRFQVTNKAADELLEDF
jgi:excisionase family DNA binding protein